MPEFEAVKRWLAVSHITGLSNVFADMASRPEKRHLMFKLAAVMGGDLTWVDIPTEWLESMLRRLLGKIYETKEGDERRAKKGVQHN